MRVSRYGMNLFAAGATALVGAVLASAQSVAPKASGEAVYQHRCAGCHEQASSRIPPRAALNQVPAERILRALDFGAMMTVAYGMSRDERQAVAAYLGTNAPAIAFPPSAYCSDRQATVSDHPEVVLSGGSKHFWKPNGFLCRRANRYDHE